MLVIDKPLTAPPNKRQFLRGNLAMVESKPGIYQVELYPDVLPGSHLLHHAATADVLIELAPGTTYTGEKRCGTTASGLLITKPG